jgi:hypothetical protein
MSLVNSNRKNSIKKIDRGHDIKPEEKFTLDDINKAGTGSSKASVDRVTFYANVRINNHIKNKLEALSTVGFAKSQKEALSDALDYYIDSLPAESKRKLKIQIATLEERDVLLKNKSNK